MYLEVLNTRTISVLGMAKRPQSTVRRVPRMFTFLLLSLTVGKISFFTNSHNMKVTHREYEDKKISFWKKWIARMEEKYRKDFWDIITEKSVLGG